MREVDRAMVEDFGIQLMQMMENAGRALATAARVRLGGSAVERSVLVLAGRGNNGGGGLVAARRLANWGARVQVVLTTPSETFEGVPALQLHILQAMVEAEEIPPRLRIDVAPLDVLPSADLILDALIGYGLQGPPWEPHATLIRQANASGIPVIALDAPSGLDPTTGIPYEPTIQADVTLTLALPKTGLLSPTAQNVVGDLFLADISVPPQLYRRMGLQMDWLFAEGDIVFVKGR